MPSPLATDLHLFLFYTVINYRQIDAGMPLLSISTHTGWYKGYCVSFSRGNLYPVSYATSSFCLLPVAPSYSETLASSS